jgi:hypothetical protein
LDFIADGLRSAAALDSGFLGAIVTRRGLGIGGLVVVAFTTRPPQTM